MSRERILEKLRKLRALSASSNPHESDTARKVADEYAKSHGITEDEAVKFENDLPIEFPVGAGFGELWKFSLLSAAAEFHECEALQLNLGDRAKARLIGSKANTRRSLKLFKDLMNELEVVEGLIHRYGVYLNAGRDEIKNLTPAEIACSLRSGIALRLIEELSVVYRKKKASVASSTGIELAVITKKKKVKTQTNYNPEVIKRSISDVPSRIWMEIAYRITTDREHYARRKVNEDLTEDSVEDFIF